MESQLLGQSVLLHGPDLVRHLQIEDQRLPDTIVDYLSNYKPRTHEIQNEDFQQKLRHFVAKKSDLLFTHNDREEDESKVNDVKMDEDDKFAKMPPLESFMGISPNYCREHFFNSLEKRDLVVGIVSSVLESGVVITILCMDGGKVRDIDELKTTAFCPVKELPRLFPNQSPIEGFQVKDKVRGVVLNVNQETEKIIVSMLERSLPEEASRIKLGLINEDDFPVHYRRKLHIRGLAFDELLQSILGFNNSGNVNSLLSLLHLSDSTSLMRGLCRKNIPEKEYAESLRKYQSQKWAHQSVANGVAMFKAGKQVEAMQYLNKALQIDSTNVEALVARGALYANNESYNRAIEDFQEALQCNDQHQNAKKYLYETLLALAKVQEDQGDFGSAETQYRKAMEIQPHSVEVRELIRYMMVRKERKERERAFRGRSPSPVPKRRPDNRSPDDRQSDRYHNKETSKTLKKLIQEDKTRHRDRRRQGGDDRDDPQHRSYTPERDDHRSRPPRRKRSKEFDSSSSSSSSSSGSSSDSSSSSDSEGSSDDKRDHRTRERDHNRKGGEMERESDKYRNPESSRETYRTEMEQKLSARPKVQSPSQVFAVDTISSFLFGADGNYRTTPPKVEGKHKAKSRNQDESSLKDDGKELSKSLSHDKLKYHKQRQSRKKRHEDSHKHSKDKSKSRSTERSSSRSERKRKSGESIEEISESESKLDSSFEKRRDRYSESESDIKYKREKKVRRSRESAEYVHLDAKGESPQKARMSSSKEKNKAEDQEMPDYKEPGAVGKSDVRNIVCKKRERSLDEKRESSIEKDGSFEEKRERSSGDNRRRSSEDKRDRPSGDKGNRPVSEEEHKRQYLDMKYESWKRATEIELGRKRKQAQYNKERAQRNVGKKINKKDYYSSKSEDGSKDGKFVDSRNTNHGKRYAGPRDQNPPIVDVVVKSKWDSPGKGDDSKSGRKRRKSRFDILPEEWSPKAETIKSELKPIDKKESFEEDSKSGNDALDLLGDKKGNESVGPQRPGSQLPGPQPAGPSGQQQAEPQPSEPSGRQLTGPSGRQATEPQSAGPSGPQAAGPSGPQPAGLQPAVRGRDLEGLRIHIRNDHFSDSGKPSESIDSTRGRSGRQSPEGSMSSSRGTPSSSRFRELSPEQSNSRRSRSHSSSQHREPSPKQRKKRSSSQLSRSDSRTEFRIDKKRDRSTSESKSSNTSESGHQSDEYLDISSGHYRKRYTNELVNKFSKSDGYFKEQTFSGNFNKLHHKQNLPDIVRSARGKQGNGYNTRGRGRGGFDDGHGGFNRGRGRGRFNDSRGRGNNDGRGRGNNDGRGRGNNDGRGRGNNDGRGRGNNDGRGRGSNDSRGRGNNDGRGRGSFRGRGGFRGSSKDDHSGGHQKYYKDCDRGHKRSRSRSWSDSGSSRSDSSSSSPSSYSDKKSHFTSSYKRDSYQQKHGSSRRSPNRYIDPYEKPEFTRARFPKVRQPELGELSDKPANPAPRSIPVPLSIEEEKKKHEVLNQLEIFLSHLKEKKKEQTVGDTKEPSVTPEKV